MKPSGATPDHRPQRRFAAHVELCLIADGDSFVSRPVDKLDLDFNGIVGDHHAGATRRAGAREPWHPRGTELRNDRQVTIVSATELAEVARAMDLRGIQPGWIGANLVLGDIPDLSLLPAGTKLLFADGAALHIEGENSPCRAAGRSVGENFPGRDEIDLLFVKSAVHKRGLIASVERPGSISQGEAVQVRIPAQRFYAPELAT